MLLLRIVWVFAFREIDGDAYGHFFIALATRQTPTRLNIHWVWLPLYHFLVAGLTLLGVTFRGLRIVNALLATAGPLLLYKAIQRRLGDEEALACAIAFAIAPLAIVLGQSAQPETLFCILLVASIFEAARDRPARAGAWLAAACMVRYEAWGAVIALGVCWIVARLRAKPKGEAEGEKPSFVMAAIPAALIAIYILFRWWTDGELLYFFRGTREITSMQVARQGGQWTFREIISFPIVLPFVIFGPTIFFAPLGARQALPKARDWVFPVGLASFLLLSYYGGGSHSGERYLVSLVPFVCVMIAVGALRIGRMIGRPRTMVGIVLAALALTTVWHLHRAAKMAIAWDAGLKTREDGLALPPR